MSIRRQGCIEQEYTEARVKHWQNKAPKLVDFGGVALETVSSGDCKQLSVVAQYWRDFLGDNNQPHCMHIYLPTYAKAQ